MNLYFERYAYQDQLFNSPPHPDLKISVVIPAFHEPDILKALDSLNQAPAVPNVEVLIIINQSEESSEEIKNYNAQSFKVFVFVACSNSILLLRRSLTRKI